MSRYEQAGVADQDDALSAVRRHLEPTFAFPADAEVLTAFGSYAAVIRLSNELALAMCTDGVGSKTMIASALDRYDTIAFDCVAMNVNDILCVGARPLAMVDYLGVNQLDARRADEILRGLGAAAKESGIAIPGGELAQLPGVIGADGDTTAFDLVGTCVGTLRPDDLILGRSIDPGNAIIGLAASGIHSNGLTLARRVLLDESGLGLGDEVAELGTTLGDELLKPTEIYVRAIHAVWDAGVQTRGLAHITGDGLLNLGRLEAPVDYRIDRLLDVPPIFDLIQRSGKITDAEMFRVFNMGIGFVVIVAAGEADAALATLEAAGARAAVIGEVEPGSRTVRVVQRGLEGSLSGGFSTT